MPIVVFVFLPGPSCLVVHVITGRVVAAIFLFLIYKSPARIATLPGLLVLPVVRRQLYIQDSFSTPNHVPMMQPFT